MISYAQMITGLRMFRVLNWRGGYEEPDDRVLADLPNAHVVTSGIVDSEYSAGDNRARYKRHKVVLDIDHEASLIPSSTPGHYHLYIDVEVEEGRYWSMLQAMAEAGVLEEPYERISVDRGHSDVRLPWIDKPVKPEPEPVVEVPASNELPPY